jgi:hypothetical protein
MIERLAHRFEVMSRQHETRKAGRISSMSLKLAPCGRSQPKLQEYQPRIKENNYAIKSANDMPVAGL